jgi:hypothetical protein
VNHIILLAVALLIIFTAALTLRAAYIIREGL